MLLEEGIRYEIYMQLQQKYSNNNFYLYIQKYKIQEQSKD